MTFTQLANHVENAFRPRRYTSVQVCRSMQKHSGCVDVEWTIYVGSTTSDSAASVCSDSIDGVKAAFDARWQSTPGEVDAESAKVDAA